MGYTTDFEGKFSVTPTLKPEHLAYLTRFCETRRVKRDAALTQKRPDPVREAVKLPIGDEGGYFVGAIGAAGQEKETNDVIDYNRPPHFQPELWCCWTPNDDGTAIAWDCSEKFYSYVEWILYLIVNFLLPWGYELDGTVEWQGEKPDDIGRIVIVKNKVSVKRGRIIFDD